MVDGRANVCVYGLPKHESGQIQIVPECKYAGGDLPVVHIERDSSASTKYRCRPEYLTMEEADKRMQKKRELRSGSFWQALASLSILDRRKKIIMILS